LTLLHSRTAGFYQRMEGSNAARYHVRTLGEVSELA
jgi:hypothetical protein